jgi:hypothetical protein
MFSTDTAPSSENLRPRPISLDGDVSPEAASAHQNAPTPVPSTTAVSRKGMKPWMKKLGIGLGIFVVILAIVGAVAGALAWQAYQVAQELKIQADDAQVIARGALDNFKAQNLPATQASFEQLDVKVAEISKTYQKLSYAKNIPFAKAYYEDGEHGLVAAQAGVAAGLKAIQAVTPYADVLGFTGEGTFEGGTAENRVKLILETLVKVTPILDEIGANLEIAQTELSYIDPNRYPEDLKGIAIRSKIIEGKELLDNANTVLEDYRPIIERLPEIAGATGERKKYLVLFQNDNELRPTGGFLTAYAVIFIENGVVTPEKSDDIYELDKKFSKKIPIPEALGRYLTTEKTFHLRDMNTSPDFKVSMDQFLENYKTIKGEPQDIDGIITVDTHLLNALIKVVGPIQVAGYGTFSAENDPRCDCPGIIYALSEIITRPTPYIRQDRKGILAPLMQGILQRIYQSPKTFMADLFKIGIESVEGRHIQAYFFTSPENQQATESINAGGRMLPDPNAEDFLGIVNANLGGAKSNLFVTYSVKQTVTGPENGVITKNVEITYVNPRHGDNCNLEAGLLCLNSTLRDWTRIYLPAGSKLVEAQGFTQEAKQYEELGFQVIDGFFILEPKGTAKLKLTYTVPVTGTTDYSIKIWKQGGTDAIPHVIDVNGGQEEVLVGKDTIYKVAY